ncbi:Hepatocellular carcinoma-associated antigen [Parasponia andersonii]|uniref:Hepatocellular carcinoma-associated antigen n=1 Tax=Parasponia andersonii TaxID=3476 RepID=A0A2P5B382_PARAD|nr:Hepatocellular carcinoma-associated antigen [Parasponia andersonii]
MQEQEQPTTKKMKKKNFRKRSASAFEAQADEDEALDQQQTRMALEEVKFLQRQRQRKSGIPAVTNNASTTEASASASDTQQNRNRNQNQNQNQNQSHKYNSSSSIKKTADSNATDPADLDKDKDKDDLVLQDTFAQETAVMVEDPNMLRYVEQELAKKRGRRLDAAPAPDQLDNIDLKNAEDELYKIPDHLKVKKRNSEESSTQWTTGIAEVQLPIEFKLRNIEETEAAKKLLQEKRLMGRSKSEFSIPSSYSADYFQRGRDYAEKLRREHPELYKDTSSQDKAGASRQNDTGTYAAVQRQAATDEFMLERFRKRERLRVMRR